MRFIVGDDTGSLKWIRVEAHKVEKLGGSRRRGDVIERLCWAGPPEDREKRFAVGYHSGAVEVRESGFGAVLGTCLPSPSRIRGLDVVGDSLLRVSADGSASVVKQWCADDFPQQNWKEDEQQHEEVENGAGAAAGSSKPTGPPQRSFKLQGPIADAKLQPGGSTRLAFGGLENDVKIFDIERGEITWQARNVRENWLCLRVPVKVATLAWATEMCPSRDLLLCGTTDAKIRVYDTKAQRRPLFEYQIGYKVGKNSGGHTGCEDDLARPLTGSVVAQGPGGGWSYIVTNTMGSVREFDLRMLPSCQTAQIPPGRNSHLKWAIKQLPIRRGYKGAMGSIRGLSMHPMGSVLTFVGLGRFAYVFETNKKRMVSKVYLKKKLTAVLMSSEPYGGVKAEDDEDSGDITGKEEEPDQEKATAGADGEEGGADAADQVEEGFSSDGEGCAEDTGGDADGEEQAKATKQRGVKAKRKLRRRSRATQDGDDGEGGAADVESGAEEPKDSEPPAAGSGGKGPRKRRAQEMTAGSRKRARKPV